MSINPYAFCATEDDDAPDWMIDPFILDSLTVSLDMHRILFSPMDAKYGEPTNLPESYAEEIRKMISQCQTMDGKALPPAHELEHENLECTQSGETVLGIKVDGIWLDKDRVDVLHTSINPVEVFGFSDKRLGFRTGDQFGIIMGLRMEKQEAV